MIVQRSRQGKEWRKPVVVSVAGKINRAVSLCLWVVLLAFGLSTGMVTAGGMPTEEEGKAITEEQAQQIIASPESAAAGEGLFNQVCVYCHGAKGIGGKARKMQCRTYDPQYLFKTISNGKKRGAYVMPSWKNSYDEKTRWELVSYIMTLKDLEKCE